MNCVAKKICINCLFSLAIFSIFTSASVLSATFDLCGINEISGENFSLSLNFTTEKAMKIGGECSRVILFKSKRVKLTVEELNVASGAVFEIQDSPGFNKGVKIGPKDGSQLPSSYVSSSNAMFIRFKDESRGGKGPSTFRGKMSAEPYQATCHCRAVKNGKLECFETERQRRCEVKCNPSYMDLSINQEVTCDLDNGKWDIDIHSGPLDCQTVQKPLKIKATVNFNYANLKCEDTNHQKVSNVFRAFIGNNSDVRSKGVCFSPSGDENADCNETRLQVNCTTNGNSAETTVTIIDRIVEPSTLKEANLKLQELYTAYNNLNLKDVLDSADLVIKKHNESFTIAKESFANMTTPWCNGEHDYIKIPGNDTYFVCSTCPLHHLYNVTTHTCQKCPSGSFALTRARSCAQKNDTTIMTPIKSSCDNKCTKGKRVDANSWMCEWCPLNTYQNSSTKVNPECIPCPGDKKTVFSGAQNVSECHDPCPLGAFLNDSSGTCQDCPIGTYMDVDKQVFIRCKMCEMGKTTQGASSKASSDCYKCMPGQFYNSTSMMCTSCPKGKYQDEMNKDSCKDCANETSTLESGSKTASECVKFCGLGKFFNDSIEMCFDCPKNTYQDLVQHHVKECKSCGLNKSTNATGQSDISRCFVSCEKGSFFNKSVSECKMCPEGHYQDQPGQDQCIPCPGDKKTVFSGAQNVSECHDPCPSGAFLNTSSSTCQDCPIGTYMDVNKHVFNRCSMCELGKTTRGAGSKASSDCYKCIPGQFYNSTSMMCTPCPKGKYQDEINKDSCKDCANETTTFEFGSKNASECVRFCGRGKFFNDSIQMCFDCPKNTYQDLVQHHVKECKSCGSNKITNATGQSDISRCFVSCDKGSFLDKSASECKTCSKGQYQDQPGKEQCKKCPDGKSTTSEGQSDESSCTDITTCSKGELYETSSNNTCNPCPYGTYQEAENHHFEKCQICPSKKTSVKEGANDRKQCIAIDKNDKFEAIEMTLKFTSMSWSEELKDKNSVMYRETKTKIEDAIQFELRNDPSFEDVKVTGFRNGSIVADFELYFNDKVDYVPGEALQVAARSGKVGNFTVSPESLKILQRDCGQPLGMENGKIKNEQITASSHFTHHEPYEGRLNLKGGRGWHARYERKDVEYLQINFKREVNITAVATQGQSTTNLYVKEYKLSMSDDGEIWNEYTENGETKLFSGNHDSDTVVRNNLADRVTSRFIRFLPQSWSDSVFMRVEVYGCLPNALIPTEPATNAASSPDVAAMTAEDDKWPWGAYLGIVFAVLLIVGVVVAIICWKKKSREKKNSTETDEALMGMNKYGDGEYRVIEKDAAEPDDDENVV